MTQLVSVLEIYYKIYAENPMTHVTADYKTKKPGFCRDCRPLFFNEWHCVFWAT